MIKVDKKIEMPLPTRGRSSIKYPFATMKIGESFLYKSKLTNTLAMQRIAAISATWASQKKSTFKFSCRKAKGGIRVWRVK